MTRPFTQPMPTWAHSHDITWSGQTHPVMRVDVENSDLTLYFTANGSVEWMVTSHGVYFRGREVKHATFHDIGRPSVVASRPASRVELVLSQAVGM